ncbi:hypothetical protein PICMEDRAFT_25204, partial [Pichia membranifaciens NRRL Y-2026]
MTEEVLYKNTGTLKIGDVHRFVVTYTPTDINKEIGTHLYVKVKNIENVLMNSVLLTGPYIMYCDIRSAAYDHNVPCFVSDDQPAYDPNMIPGQSLVQRLTLNRLQAKYVWVVDVVSQIIFSTTASTGFEILLARDEQSLHRNYSCLRNSNYSPSTLNIQHLTTADIWNRPPRSICDPIHLVILVHGLHSNSTADMFYMKDRLEGMADKTGENLVIRAYSGNVCKTERGIKYLGRRLAEYIVKDSLEGLNGMVEKISFISHSLGGPVQTFAISYINFNYPDFFERIKPENFIAMASPMLGISNENPTYVKVFLKFGIVGKTGQDLNLDGAQPMLLLLPSEPTRKILKAFKRRTVYANVLNDGIVPLRTSALLYLDWKGLTKVYETLKNNAKKSSSGSSSSTGYVADKAAEIPVDMNNDTMDSTDGDRTFVDSIKSRIQSTIGFCLPSIQASKTTNKYSYFQTTDMEVSDSEATNDNTSTGMDSANEALPSIPKSSALSSIKRVLLPPTPSSKYINDPKSRYDVILHDKIYTPDMIPKRHTTLSKNVILSQLEQKKKHRYLEETIARRWHQGMSWRKVLVYLQPDAHNNMVVRRRFANAYGWQVIDHMVEEHFSKKCCMGEDLSSWKIKKSDCNLIDLDEEESRDLNVKLGQVMNKEYRKESKRHHINSPDLSVPERVNIDSDSNTSDLDNDSANNGAWLNEEASGYYDGPTGLLNSVNEGVAAWKES